MSQDNLQPNRPFPAPMRWLTSLRWQVVFAMAAEKKNFFRAFLDFFVLFSGVSTASNLSRTRKSPVLGRGMFLFRKPEKPRDDSSPTGR